MGQALGDTLGCVVEGATPGTCREYVETRLRLRIVGTKTLGSHPFGQYTDDTQLARELLQSLVERRGLDPGDYASRIVRLFVDGRIVGHGRATEEAARRLASGVPWDEAGTPPPAAGNGSAMRAAPIGLMFFDRPDELIAAAHDQGRITHADPRCSAGAVAIAGGVALALRPGPLDVAGFVQTLRNWTSTIDESMASALGQLPALVPRPPAEAIVTIADAGKAPGFADGWHGISPFVVPSVLWSLFSFLRTPDDYWETICTAIAVGGDVDTTAAMAGALSGAHLGIARIPGDVARRVNDNGTWTYDELVRLAELAHELKRRRDFGASDRLGA